MELKKSKKADLQSKKGMFAQIGLIVSLLLITGMFNISQSKIEIEIVEAEEEEVVVELPPVTRPEEPVKQRVQKVVAPSITDKIEIVENEVELEETELFNPETDEFTPNWAGLPTGVPNDGDILIDDSAPVFKAEVDPTFGGEAGGKDSQNAFRKWVQKRVKYPAIVSESNISGAVSLRFVIGKDGKITDITVLSSPDKLLTEEVTRVMLAAPAWTPGLQREKPVPVYATIRVVFVL